MEELLVNLPMGGGSIPTSPLQYRVEECEFKSISPIFERYHYKGAHMGGGIFASLKLTYKGNIQGGAVVGKPRQENFYSNGKKRVMEIRRMACLDECPKNTESYFLGKLVWIFKKKNLCDLIISYSDLSVGHIGTIYKAANFKLIGKTEPSIHVFWNGKRYHPRSLTIERPYSHELRKAVEAGNARIETGKEKLIWAYTLKLA